MHIFINLTSNLYCLAPLFLIVCPLSISSSFVLFPIYSSKTGLCLLQYSQLSRGCDNVRCAKTRYFALKTRFMHTIGFNAMKALGMVQMHSIMQN